MKEYLYFTYNGIHSKDMGIFNANTETGMFEEPFLSRRTINETEIRGRSKPYFHGVQRAPLQFTLKLVFEEKYDDEKISEVARWLDQDDYKEFYFDDNPEQRFFCIPVEDITHIHNGLKEGYLELTMRCNDAYSYSPEYISRIYDFTDNPLKYSESSYEEFQNGKELNGLVISEEGSIQLEKEGIDFNKIIQSDTDWQSEGVFDKTKIKNSKLELEYKIEPGINYNKTEDTQSDWEYDGSDQPEYVYASPLRQDSDGDGVVDGWSRTPDLPDVTESFSVDSAEEAQKISVTNTSTAGPHYINIFKIIPVKTTSTYSFSGDLRVANAVGNFIARLTITWLDASQNVISHSLGAGYGNTDYVRAKLENLTPPENAAYAMIKCEVRVSSVGDSGNAWFKNIYFNKGAVALDYPGSIIKHLDTTISPGDLTLAKEGSDLEKIVQKDIEWVEGDHFNTTHNDDQLMLDFEIPPGEDYAKTDETQQDWEDPDAVLENLDTITSPGNLQLQKEGTDYVDDESSTSDWDTGSHVNTRSIDNHLELDWDMPPGKDVILANSDDDDWNNAESMVGVVSKNNTLQLAKEGSDFNALYTSNADFQGTHDGTIAINNKIQLIDQGSDYDRYIKSRSDFDLGTYNKTVYSGSSNGYVKLNNLPSWEMESDLSDFLKDFYTPDEHVYQRNGYVDIYVTHKHPYNDDNGIKVRDRIVSYPLTCDFLAKISGDTHIYMSDMPPGKRVGNYIKIYGLPRSSSWAWYRVILRKNGCEIYRNGKRVYPDKVKTGTTTTWTNRLTLMVDNGHIGRMQITHFYMRSGVDLGPPPTNNLYTGTWTSQEFDISGAGVVKQTSFNYSWAKNGKNTEYQNVIMEVRVKKNGVWGSWQTVNGNTIPGISNGENLSNTNARMQIRATLQSYDPGYTPHLKDISFSIRSTSYTSGSYTSKVIDISHVVKVSSTNIRWSWNSNGAGSITSWVRIGDDDGFGTITWGSWQQATNGGTIPGIDSSTDFKLFQKHDLPM